MPRSGKAPSKDILERERGAAGLFGESDASAKSLGLELTIGTRCWRVDLRKLKWLLRWGDL